MEFNGLIYLLQQQAGKTLISLPGSFNNLILEDKDLKGEAIVRILKDGFGFRL